MSSVNTSPICLPNPHRSRQDFWTYCFGGPQHGHPRTGGCAGPIFGGRFSRIIQGVPDRITKVHLVLSLIHSLSHPITNATLFVAFLCTEGRAPSTIESYLAALHFARLRLDPLALTMTFHSPYMNTLLRGIKRVHSRSGKPARVRLLITASLMHSIKGPLVLQPQDYNSVMVWAVCCTGFFGFLWRGEFLIPDDVHLNPDIHLALDDIPWQTTRADRHFI